MILRFTTFLISIIFMQHVFAATELSEKNPMQLYRWALSPEIEKEQLEQSQYRLENAIKNPEFALDCWIHLPFAPKVSTKKIHHLSLKESILLALRYNPNIQSAELDRILNRYQLRLAQAEFEMQYALGATAFIQHTHFSGSGNATNTAYAATPEISYKNRLGGQLSVNMNNKLAEYGNYDPVVTANYVQPLLRGFGSINNIPLLNAVDNEHLNKLNLRQTVMDQITDVINAYQSLILTANAMSNQKRQLIDAQQIYQNNQKKIEAGTLETTANIQQAYQVETLKMMAEQGENDFNVASQNLLQRIGLSPKLRLAVPNDLPMKKLKIPKLEETIDKALKQNLQYIALNLNLASSKRALEHAKNQQLWSLDLNANLQAGVTNDVQSNKRGISAIYSGNNLIEAAGVSLKIPIHDLNRRNQLLTAKIQLEKAEVNLHRFKQTLITNIQNTISTIKSHAKRYELAQKQVELAKQSYELEKKKLNAGITTSLEVNNTQNQLVQAEVSLITAKFSYFEQIAALNRLIGATLDEWDIKLRYR